MSTPDILTALQLMENRLAERIDAAAAGLRLEFNGKFDAFAQRLDRLEAEYAAIRIALERLETRMDRLETRMDGLESRVEQLGRDLAAFRDEVASARRTGGAREIEVDRRIDELDRRVRTLERRQPGRRNTQRP